MKMVRNKKLVTIVFITFLIAEACFGESKTNSYIEVPIVNSYSFACKSNDECKIKKFLAYNSCAIKSNKAIIYTFDTVDEFKIEKDCPTFGLSGIDTFLYFHLVNRINNDKILKIKISNQKIIRINEMPYFSMMPFTLDSTNELFLIGLLSTYETWNDKMPYDPVLAYRVKYGDIELDTNRTEKINKEIYGKFYGIKYLENVTFKLNDIQPRLNKILNKFDCKNVANNIKCRE